MFNNAKPSRPDIFQEIIDLDNMIENYIVDFKDPVSRNFFREMCKDRSRVRDACATFIQQQKGPKA